MRVLIAIAFSAASYSVAAAQLSAQLSELRRDAALEQQVVERRSSRAQLLQPEGKSKVTRVVSSIYSTPRRSAAFDSQSMPESY